MKNFWPLGVFWIAITICFVVPVLWFIEVVHYKGWGWTIVTLLVYFVALGAIAGLLEDNRRK
jgi:hypothetical protein